MGRRRLLNTVPMLARRLSPLAGLVALVAFLVPGLPAALALSWSRVTIAWHNRALDAEEALASHRGLEYVAAIRRIREQLPSDSEYLLLSAPGDVFVRFDLAPRRAIFGGDPGDVANNVTPEKLRTLPEWTIVPRLAPPGPRLFKTSLLAEKGAVP